MSHIRDPAVDGGPCELADESCSGPEISSWRLEKVPPPHINQDLPKSPVLRRGPRCGNACKRLMSGRLLSA